MDRARTLGVQTVKLDATDQGRPLYESFGFRPEQPIERWQLGPGTAQCPDDAASRCLPFDSRMCDLDAESCGYDRRELLTRLAARSEAAAEGRGYALHRHGRIARYFGPCIAASRSAAQTFVANAVASHPGTSWFWDLLPTNEGAVAIARELGFECVRKLTRMTWGRDLRGKEQQVFAIGGFEFG
jgi:hypothetical protein